MKTYTIFTVILLFFCSIQLHSQEEIYNDKKNHKKYEPINSGFVFIDGKYVDIPYEFELSGNKIFLNKKIVKEGTKVNYKNTHVTDFPCYPPDSVAYNLNYVNPETNNILISDVVTYYVNKYGMDSASWYIKEYVCNLNGINCLETNDLSIKLITIHNGMEYYSTLGWNTLYQDNNNLEKNSVKNKDIFKEHSSLIELYLETLKDGGIIIFSENKSNISEIISHENSLEFINKTIPIINDENTTFKSKKNLLKETYSLHYPDIIIKSGFPSNDKLKKRIKDNLNDTTSYNQYDYSNKSKSQKTVDNYSPNRNDVIYICPYIDDPAFDGSSGGVYNYQDEINLFNSVFNGYSYSQVTTITDERGDEVANIPISVWKNLNAGIINISAHGMENNSSSGVLGGTIIAIFDFGNTTLALDYINSEQYIVNNLVVPSGSTVLQNCVTATESFWANNTQQTLNANNSVVFLSTCNGNIVADDIGGGAIFSFNQPVTFDDIYNDFRNILRNMNGQINSGDTRSAWEAYLSVNSTHGLELIPLLADITLCPATKTYSPSNGETVASSPPSGYFEIDTRCDATKDPYQALNITTTGGVTLSSVAWDNPTGGKSNKINYTWTGTNGSVTVEVNPQHIVSYGGGNHQLDFNKETPNTETGYYTFYVDQGIAYDVPVADFTYSVNNNSVSFLDASTQSPTSWTWDFGDGYNSNQQNVMHVYSTTGTYPVTLIATNSFGSSTPVTKYVTVSNTPSGLTISGTVYKSGTFIPVPNAVITSSSGDYSFADINGNYSINVDYGWSGTLTASANNYTDGFLFFTNPIYSNQDNQDFYLFEVGQMYIISDKNNVYQGVTINFSAINVPSGYDYYWDFGDTYTTDDNSDNPTASYSYGVGGTYNVSLTLTHYISGAILPTLHFTINIITPEENDHYSPAFVNQCNVIDKGTTACFYDVSYFPYSDYVCWLWFFDHGGNESYSELFYKDTQSYPDQADLTVCHTFNDIGNILIKLQSYLFGTWLNHDFVFDNYYLINEEASWSAVNVIDCDLTSPFYLLGPLSGFMDAVRDEWAYNNNVGPIYIYGGTLTFNGQANNYLNAYDMTLSACKEIIIEGDQEFIANGNNELILEINQDVCKNTSKAEMTASNQVPLENDSSFVSYNVLKINPNPFTDNLSVNLSIAVSQDLQIVLTDIYGRKLLLLEKPILEPGSYLYLINTINLPPGFYFLSSNINNEYQTVKLIKTDIMK